MVIQTFNLIVMVPHLSLCIASQHGHTDVVSLLLKANADTSLGNKGTPLAVAAAKDHTQIVQLLLDNGADPNILKFSAITALICMPVVLVA